MVTSYFQAPPSIEQLERASSGRMRIVKTAGGRTTSRIYSRSEFERRKQSGDRPFVYYFERAHTVVYRVLARFPVIVIDYAPDPPSGLSFDDYLKTGLKAQPPQIIDGSFPIFRRAGTVHSVYIDDEVLQALGFDPSSSVSFVDCEKDFSPDGDSSG